jgi:hypothetical protein
VEETKPQVEQSPEERRERAILRLAPKNVGDYEKIFKEWLCTFFDDHL